jgi:5'-nucleotidase
LLNVNVPAVPLDEVAGFTFTRQGKSFWQDTFEKRLDPQQRPYYWLKGEYVLVDHESDIDDVAIREKKISITPLQYDLTDYDFLDTMSENWPNSL